MIHSAHIARRPAFTLAELIVALSISSIIMLAIVGSFRLGLQVWRRVEERRPTEETGRRILAVLARELACVYLVPSGQDKTGFQREGSNKLSFFTANPSYYHGLPFGRCGRVTYEFKDGALTRTEELAATERLIALPVTQVIAEGLRKCEFAYPQDPGLSADGNSDSPAQTQPPRLVSVTMQWPQASCSGQCLVPVQELLAPDGQE